MSDVIDFTAACEAFAATHNWNEDPPTYVGVNDCPHFGPWAESLLGSDSLSDVNRAYLALSAAVPAPPIAVHLTDAVALLGQADVPRSWIGAIEGISVATGRGPVSWAAVGAIYGEVARRLHAPMDSRAAALSFAHLVEGAMALAAWCRHDNRAYDDAPNWEFFNWWPHYLDRVNAYLTPKELAALSSLGGGFLATEAMSSVTPPERLAEMYRGDRLLNGPTRANPNLPPALVNQAMKDDWDLLFHPNADPELSWSVIRGILEGGEASVLGEEHMGEFHPGENDSWAAMAGFAVDGPHAPLLRGRIRAWCDENIDDEDERLETLVTLGLANEDS